jgi:hypothetical protein
MTPLLDWGNGKTHWSSTRARCRHCGGYTHLRTTDDRPAHKVCEEAAPDGEGNTLPPPQSTTRNRKSRR